jgi:hypothetical protein
MTDRRGNTALHYATKYDYEQVVATLLAVGADPFAINKQGLDSQMMAYKELSDPDHSRVVRMLCGAKAIWMRVGRGAQETRACANSGTRCALTYGTSAESIVSVSSGRCNWCGCLVRRRSCRFPHVLDNMLTCSHAHMLTCYHALTCSHMLTHANTPRFVSTPCRASRAPTTKNIGPTKRTAKPSRFGTGRTRCENKR